MKYRTFEELATYINACDRPIDLEKVKKAYELAEAAHSKQLRLSGEPYVSHPIEVAFILVDLGMDTDSVCAGLLHDVVEDTEFTVQDLTKRFGSDVAALVDGVTKLGKVPLSTKEEQQAENVRKMLLAMADDVRVIIIKLADRLHNMRTLMYKPEKKQRETSLETMEVYAPIAHRLGIRAVKEEIEDLALHYLDPVACKEIETILANNYSVRTNFVKSIQDRIADRLQEYDIEPHIEGRVKSLYGIYRKVYMAGRGFDEVYDIYAVRIIVSTVIECYNILGIIHDMFRPIPNRFKDYISTPKPNMYQSLHTTVIGREGIPFEIQIRTWDMQYTAEYGVAAHWKYKAGIKDNDNKMEEGLAWVRRIIESQKEGEGAEDIVRTIKTDLASEEVFVFTPKGDVKSLPIGSTVIDFAYAIHSAVGNKMIGAKIDSRIVSLDTVLKTGQIVDIITTKSESHGPNREWLNIAKTSEARNKIRAWFKRERREENILEGKIELEREMKRNYINLPEKDMQDFILQLGRRQHYETTDDFYAAIGYGGVILSRIMQRIKDDYQKIIKPADQALAIIKQNYVPSGKGSNGVIVEGIDNCLVKFSQCCNPLPGDDIIGFITRGHGVSVHKKDCVNVIASMAQEEQRPRWIAARFADSIVPKGFRSTLDIVATDRNGLLADVSIVLANFRVPLHELNARELKNQNCNIAATFGIQDVEQLNNIIEKIEKIEGVLSVERSGK